MLTYTRPTLNIQYVLEETCEGTKEWYILSKYHPAADAMTRYNSLRGASECATHHIEHVGRRELSRQVLKIIAKEEHTPAFDSRLDIGHITSIVNREKDMKDADHRTKLRMRELKATLRTRELKAQAHIAELKAKVRMNLEIGHDTPEIYNDDAASPEFKALIHGKYWGGEGAVYLACPNGNGTSIKRTYAALTSAELDEIVEESTERLRALRKYIEKRKKRSMQ